MNWRKGSIALLFAALSVVGLTAADCKAKGSQCSAVAIPDCPYPTNAVCNESTGKWSCQRNTGMSYGVVND